MIKQCVNGNRIIDFLPVHANGTLPVGDPSIPLTAALCVMQHERQFLLVYNTKRNQWESVSGGIDPGETPVQTAVREVWEESSQRIEQPQALGLVKFYIHATDSTEYFAFYHTRLDALRPFVANEETTRMTLWTPNDVLDDRHGDLSQWAIGTIV